MGDAVFPLIVGLLGSFHCLGMCGPLVLAYSFHLPGGEANQRRAGMFSWGRASAHHLAFHAGRLLTYGLLGAAAAGLLQAVELSRFLSSARLSATLWGGVLLVLLGLVILRLLPIPSLFESVAAMPTAFCGRHFNRLLRSGNLGSRMLLGMATGTLPCCLSWAMIVTAAATQDPIRACFMMVTFGAGTVPGLLVAGLSTAFVSHRMRFLGERAAGLLLIFTGVVFIFKGVGILA